MDFSKKNLQSAYSIADKLRKDGHIAYFAGGCVRDFLMNKEPEDIDIATSAHPDRVEALFPRTIPVGKQFGVILVLDGEKTFEVATFRTEGGYVDGRHPGHIAFSVPEEDARRRDFTVNGLFYDPFEKKILDFVGGQEDLKSKRIRAIGNPEERFSEDKLRLLRAVRFSSSLGFLIEEKTWSAVCKNAALIHQVSPERIRDEIVKIFTRPNPARGLDLLSDSGLLKEILPEVEKMKGCEQQPDYHPEGDVYVHTRLLLEKLENPSLVLALGALFHDVGKPVTYQVKDGKIKFYEHAPIGARMTRGIMKRLRFSGDEIEAVAECVDNHMKFGDVRKMRSGKLKMFVTRPTFETEMELHRIDCASSHGMLDNYYFLKEKLKEYAKEELKPKAFLNGHDLMALGLPAGREIKQMLEDAYLLQLEDTFKTREEALDWARKEIKGKCR